MQYIHNNSLTFSQTLRSWTRVPCNYSRLLKMKGKVEQVGICLSPLQWKLMTISGTIILGFNLKVSIIINSANRVIINSRAINKWIATISKSTSKLLLLVLPSSSPSPSLSSPSSLSLKYSFAFGPRWLPSSSSSSITPPALFVGALFRPEMKSKQEKKRPINKI